VQSVLEAAIQVFNQHGYDNASTTQITERAGVSVGSLYQYFPDKESILFALAEQHLHEGQAAIEHTLNRMLEHQFGLAESVELIVTDMFALHEPYAAFHQLLHQATPRGGSDSQLHSRMELSLLISARRLPLFDALDPVQRDQHLLFAIRAVETLVHSFIARPVPELRQEQVIQHIACMVAAYCQGVAVTG
jgi:AcrR family transcriptional regulator